MSIDRRLFVAGLTAAALPALPANAAAPIGTVRVDVGPLAAKGAGAIAAIVKPALERELAGLRGAGRGGATLEVVVTAIHMTVFAGGAAGTYGNDTLESEARLIEGGRVVGNWPVRATLPASSGGAWYLPDVDRRRVEALARANAAWIRRYVGA